MSDKNEIIRVTDIVETADGDFGERVTEAFNETQAERVVDSNGSTIGEAAAAREAARSVEDVPPQCARRYASMRCTLWKGHEGRHLTTGSGDSPIEWNEGESDLLVAPEGSPPIRRMSLADIPKAPAGDFLSAADIERLARGRLDAPVDFTHKQPLKPKKPWTVNIGMPNNAMVLPGQSVTVTEQMQILFRAKQIVAASEGGKLYITGVFVGQRVQMMQWSGNGMLIDFLRERTAVEFDTAEIGLNITFQVMNRGTTPGTFDITLFGEAVLP